MPGRDTDELREMNAKLSQMLTEMRKQSTVAGADSPTPGRPQTRYEQEVQASERQGSNLPPGPHGRKPASPLEGAEVLSRQVSNQSRRMQPLEATENVAEIAHRGPGRPLEGGESFAARTAVVARRGARQGFENVVQRTTRDVVQQPLDTVRTGLLAGGAIAGTAGLVAVLRRTGLNSTITRWLGDIGRQVSSSAPVRAITSRTANLATLLGTITKGLNVAAGATLAFFTKMPFAKMLLWGVAITAGLFALNKVVGFSVGVFNKMITSASRWGNAILAQASQVAAASPSMAAVLAQFRASELVSTQQFGEATADSTGRVAGALARLNNQLRQASVFFTNFRNDVASLFINFTTFATGFIRKFWYAPFVLLPALAVFLPPLAFLRFVVPKVVKLVDGLLVWLQKAIGIDDTPGLLPMERFVNDVISGKYEAAVRVPAPEMHARGRSTSFPFGPL